MEAVLVSTNSFLQVHTLDVLLLLYWSDLIAGYITGDAYCMRDKKGGGGPAQFSK